MMRNILVTLLFFFGPAFLMFVVRNTFLYWRMRRNEKVKHIDVIDITPVNQTSPSRFFLASAITVGCIFAFFAWSQLNHNTHMEDNVYIPAHMDAQGKLVPEQRLPRTP